MACVKPDGKPTKSGIKMLEASKEFLAPEEIASNASLPLFRVRSGVRDLVEAGFLEEKDGKYKITNEGLNILKK